MTQASTTPPAAGTPRTTAQAPTPGSGPVLAPGNPQPPALPQPPAVPPAPTEGVITVPPPWAPPNRNDDVPEGAVILGMTFFIVTGLVFVLFPFMRALARRLDRAAPTPGAGDAALGRETAERLQRIEHAVESISIEVERISEGQRFTTRLLSERAPGVPVERSIGGGA